MIRPLTIALALTLASPALAQEKPPQMTPEQQAMMEAYRQAGAVGPQHEALANAAGSYDLSIRHWMAPDAEPVTETGTATREMILDGRVMAEDMQSTMQGQPFTGYGLHGYDNVTGEWWATWNDSMSTGLMVAKGDCDDAGNCSFTGSWHDPVTRQEVTSRMTTRWTTPDVEVFELYGPGPDGEEFKMMEITYTRR